MQPFLGIFFTPRSKCCGVPFSVIKINARSLMLVSNPITANQYSHTLPENSSVKKEI